MALGNPIDRGSASRGFTTSDISVSAFTPSANSLIIAIVQLDSVTSDPDSITGHTGGTAWTKIGSSESRNSRTTSVWASHAGASPSSEAVTVASSVSTTMGVKVAEITTGTTAQAIANFVDQSDSTNNGGTSASLTLTGADTLTVGFWGCDNATITPDDTAIGSELSYRYGNSRVHMDYNASGNAAPGCSFSASINYRVHAVEFSEPAAGGSTPKNPLGHPIIGPFGGPIG